MHTGRCYMPNNIVAKSVMLISQLEACLPFELSFEFAKMNNVRRYDKSVLGNGKSVRHLGVSVPTFSCKGTVAPIGMVNSLFCSECAGDFR